MAVVLVSVAGVLGTVGPAWAESYTVRPGDTLSVVARDHGVTVAELQAANRLSDPNRLVAGRALVIPPLVHVVQPGEALSVIARRYGTTTAALAAANGISDLDHVRAGQTLRVRGAGSGGGAPSPAPTSAPAGPAAVASVAPATTNHVIRPGEALSILARRLGTTTAELLRLNDLPNPHRIRAGDVLVVPARAAAPAAGSAATADAARYPNLPRALRGYPERLSLIPSFERWAAAYGLPVELLMAVAYKESGWQASALSNKGAQGIGQLMPTTAAWVASRIVGLPGLNPTVPDDNIRMSAAYLSWLHRHMGGRDLAIAAYFQGPNAVRALGVLPVSEAYLAGVTGLLGTFRRG